MAFDEEYRELVDDARDAIRALLAESNEDAWIDLRRGLREIAQAVKDEECADRLRRSREKFREHREALKESMEDLHRTFDRRGATKPVDDVWETRRDQKDWWRKQPRAYREGLILDVIGAGRLSLREIAERINERLFEHYPIVCDSNLQTHAKDLRATGDLDRVSEPTRPGSGRSVYRYFRTQPALDGPIAELEQRFHEAA